MHLFNRNSVEDRTPRDTISRRIAHVLPWPTVGGIEVATLRVAKAVRERGFESVAFCPEPDRGVVELFTNEGFEAVLYERVDPSYRRPLPYLRNSVSLARRFRHQEIDLVHCSDVLGAFYAGLAGRLARLPVLSQVRNRYDDLSGRDQTFLRLVHHFAFVSESTWRQFSYSIPSSRGTVTYDGIESAPPGDSGAIRQEIVNEFGLSAGATLIGMVARVAPQKDYHTLVDAVEILTNAGKLVRVIVVGDHTGADTYRAHYADIMRYIRSKELEEVFVFTGFRTDVSRLLAGIDIFVLCTHLEGLPLVLLEALSHGIPTVATAVDGVPEIIEHGKTGLLHAHEDAENLANQISTLIESPKAAEKLGEAGRERVKTEFSPTAFATSFAELYSRLMR